tara:strand:- start:114 stop:1592 length:1479 start_codon:yes stop_codon:yes gene_type:complete
LQELNKKFLMEFIPQLKNFDQEIKGVCVDSRQVKKGDLFFAYEGISTDGNIYIEQAIQKGAIAIISDSISDPKKNIYRHDSLRKDLGLIISNLFNNPSKKLKLFTVTGTNGKTSTVEFISGLINKQQGKCGYLSTIGWCLDGVNLQKESSLTTPNSLEINKQLNKMHIKGMNYAALEASSHGLDQGRLDGLEIDTAIFTSFSQDHLDYHQTMQNYADSKKKLFLELHPKKSVINIDNVLGKSIYTELTKNNLETYSVSGSLDADISYKTLRDNKNKVVLKVISPFGNEEINFNTYSEYLAINGLSAIVSATLEGFKFRDLVQLSSNVEFSKGRMSAIKLDEKNLCFIDYAHTPEALEKVLKDLRSFSSATIWCVFGCGGDRDKSKRMKMGKASIDYADKVILTNDNPRNEDPDEIIQDILNGLKNTQNIKVELDRRRAIDYCLQGMKENENENILLIAGKGHEEFQEINQNKIKFSDFDQVTNFLNKYGKSS